jgi:hypothetical protein
LADAHRAFDEAKRNREAAEEDLAAHREQTRRVADDELARDREGRIVIETLRARAYLARRVDEERVLAERVRAAREREREAEAAVEAARTALAEARAAREAIERHYAAWQQARRKAIENMEEEEAEERATRQR